MSQLNMITIEGNLCADPILRQTGSGKDVCNLRVASNQQFKNGNGDEVKRVTYVDVVAWAGLARVVAEHKIKGDGVIITGRLDEQHWEKEGVKHSKHVIVANNVRFLTSHKKEVAAENSDNAADATVVADEVLQD